MDMVFALNFYNEVSNAITQHIFDVILEAVQKVNLLGFHRVQASKCSPKVLRLSPNMDMAAQSPATSSVPFS